MLKENQDAEQMTKDEGSAEQRSSPVVDALGTGVVENYQRLMKEFGIQDFSPLIHKLPPEKRHYLMRRGIIFGHTGMEPVIDAIINGEKFAVMTGIKPSSSYHVGSLMTAMEVVHFQRLGGKVYFCVADYETYVVNNLSFNDAIETAIDNIADLLALGLDPKNAYIYKQSSEELVKHYGLIFSAHVTMNELRGVYGEKPRLGYYNVALIQVADILLPQIMEGSMPTITPVGADQAPHARLSRDIVRRSFFKKRFTLPSFTYHRLIGGIDGSYKMSKSSPLSYFFLHEDMKDISYKIRNAFTGGRDTAEEQRRLGGRPEICRIFDLFKFMFEEDDNSLIEREQQCKSGELLCGPCKKQLIAKIEDYRHDHLEKKESLLEQAKEIIMSLETPQV